MAENRLDYSKIQLPKKDTKSASRRGTDSRPSSPDHEIIVARRFSFSSMIKYYWHRKTSNWFIKFKFLKTNQFFRFCEKKNMIVILFEHTSCFFQQISFHVS